VLGHLKINRDRYTIRPTRRQHGMPFIASARYWIKFGHAGLGREQQLGLLAEPAT